MEKNKITFYDVQGSAFHNELVPNGAVRLNWDSSIGFGQFEIIFDENGKAHLDTEFMCNSNDKSFAYEIMKQMIDESIVEG